MENNISLDRRSRRRRYFGLSLGKIKKELKKFMHRYKREPTGPGEILLEEFLVPLGISQKTLSEHLGCDYKVVNRIINGKASVTPKIAIKLAEAFETTPEFWLNAQTAVDIWKFSQHHKNERHILSLLPGKKKAIA